MVFLGTPEVAARSLELLLQASRQGRCVFVVLIMVDDTRSGGLIKCIHI